MRLEFKRRAWAGKIAVMLSLLLLFACGGACAQEAKLMLPIGHTGPLNSAKFSPDGKRVVTASNDLTAKIWDVATGALLAELKGHLKFVYRAEFSADGKQILTASFDSTAKIWNASSGNLLLTLKGHHSQVWNAHFSPGGQFVVTGSRDSTAIIWNALTGKKIHQLSGQHGGLLVADFNHHGTQILTASADGTTIVWDVASGNQLMQIKDSASDFYFAAFSHNDLAIVTHGANNSATVWNSETGKKIATLNGHRGDILKASFSSDDTKILTASLDSTAKTWDIKTGNLLSTFTGHDKMLWYAAFSRDDKQLITTSSDKSVRMWNASTGQFLFELKGHTNFSWTAEFSPDGRKIITASVDKTAKLWDAKTGALLKDLKGYTSGLWSVVSSPDGRQVITVSGDKTAKVWSVETGNLVFELTGHTDTIRSAFVSPDGKKIATLSDDHTARLWRCEDGNLIAALQQHKGKVTAGAFSADSRLLATVSEDGLLLLWDANNGVIMSTIQAHKASIASVQFNADGSKIITASDDSTAALWDVASGRHLKSFTGHHSTVSSALFSPDGKRILTRSMDTTVRAWNPVTGDSLFVLRGHSDDILSVAFSPDGTKIVTASTDKTAKIWNALNGQLMRTLTGHLFNVRSAVFSADGKKILTGSRDNTAKIWDAETGVRLQDFKGVDGDVQSAGWLPGDSKIIMGSGKTSVSIWDAATAAMLYSFFTVGKSDYLLVDKDGHYDGTEAARKMLYYTCGTEVITLDQVKEKLWTPRLAKMIMSGTPVAEPKLSDIDICGLTPEVESIDETGQLYHFKITPRRGGLGETVLSVNGIEVKRYQPAELTQRNGYYELKIKSAVLKNNFTAYSDNPVTVKSYTAGEDVTSRGIVVKRKKDSSRVAEPNLYAIMIGVSDYSGDAMDLNFAAKDAEDMSVAVAVAARKLLNKDSKDHVFMYNLITGNQQYLLPQKQAFKKTLEDIGRKATANDILLIFFAGHGLKEQTDSSFYFLSADASNDNVKNSLSTVGISTAELAGWIHPDRMKIQNRAMIFDACNSGQAIDDFEKIIDRLKDRSGLSILCASAGDQNAYELPKYKHGLLTYSLLKSIKETPGYEGAALPLDVGSWFNDSYKSVPKYSSSVAQKPQLLMSNPFTIGLIDNDVMASIRLQNELLLFAGSNFQNTNDNAVSDDDLELTKYINQQLNEVASRGVAAPIDYATGSNAPDAWVISGRYTLQADNLEVQVKLRRNSDKETRFRFKTAGKKDALKTLAESIVRQATAWIVANK